jgi:MOSC domain-containing protein
VPTVARFNVTPVKSSSLHHPDEIELGLDGVPGDRRFLILHADGRRLSGGEKAPFLGVLAELEAGRLSLAFPGGATVEGEAAPAGDPHSVALYDREVLVRDVPGPFGEALSTRAGHEVLLARVEEPEYAGGSRRVSLLSLASVRDLGRRGGEDAPDPRRFRMLIELEGDEPYEEDGWSGRRARIGGAVVLVGGRMPRCVLTTLDPDTGRKDFPALDVLARYRRSGADLQLGVYGDVEVPGRVRVGDPVEPA